MRIKDHFHICTHSHCSLQRNTAFQERERVSEIRCVSKWKRTHRNEVGVIGTNLLTLKVSNLAVITPHFQTRKQLHVLHLGCQVCG